MKTRKGTRVLIPLNFFGNIATYCYFPGNFPRISGNCYAALPALRLSRSRDSMAGFTHMLLNHLKLFDVSSVMGNLWSFLDGKIHGKNHLENLLADKNSPS